MNSTETEAGNNHVSKEAISETEDPGEGNEQPKMDAAVDTKREGNTWAGDFGENQTEFSRQRKLETGDSDERKRENEGPPEDDCCPICFGIFTVACRANCGHWYCGSCILQFWNYSAASRPCKCPMCSRSIIKLTPQTSLQQSQEQEVREVLANVQRYNRLFVGGILGLVQKVRELPFFMKRIFHGLMDPDRNESYLSEVRLVAMVLGILYSATEFDFIPTGGLGAVRLFDYSAVFLVIILRLIGLYRRRRLAQQVRRLANVQPLQE